MAIVELVCKTYMVLTMQVGPQTDFAKCPSDGLESDQHISVAAMSSYHARQRVWVVSTGL